MSQAVSYAVATAAAAGHAYFLYSQYDVVVGKPTAAATNASVVVPVVMSTLYIGGVALGKNLMRDRQAFEITPYMNVYNIYATLLSAWMMVTIASETIGRATGTFSFYYDWVAVPVDPTPRGSLIAYAIWVNYQSKYIEFCDTLFMLLRKKFKQVSTLHVVHHAIMGPIMWLVFTGAPGGPSAFGPMLNSGVHTLMYAYYGLTGLGIRPPALWKQSMTSIQLLQFMIAMYHAIVQLVNPNVWWPMHLAVVESLLMVLMLYMFGGFFMEEYLGAGKAKGKTPKSE